MIGEVSRIRIDSETRHNRERIWTRRYYLGFIQKNMQMLFYFCLIEDVGGKVSILDFNDINRPNQRHDILLTMAYGKPTKFSKSN